MVDLYTEDDLEGCMTPKMHLCYMICTASGKCRRHVNHHPEHNKQTVEALAFVTLVQCNTITKPAYYPVPKVKPNG